MIRVVLLTGPKGTGKTIACRRFVQKARELEMRVGGILAPARYNAGASKVGIDIVDVLTGEGWALATIEPEIDRRTVGQYRFDAEAMAWALKRVMLALDMFLDVVIIDEIGPLEMRKGGGFAPALECLLSAKARSAILLVRPDLLACLQERLEDLSPTTITLTMPNRDQVPERLLEEVQGHLRSWGASRT